MLSRSLQIVKCMISFIFWLSQKAHTKAFAYKFLIIVIVNFVNS